MREIKFRAWDNVNERMELNVHHLDSLNEILHKEKYDIMQFTGLNDKNGNPIYEGDICSYVNPYNKQSYIREIKFCPMFACFGLFQSNGNIYDYESDWLKIVDVEILGNIHENKNLLQ